MTEYRFRIDHHNDYQTEIGYIRALFPADQDAIDYFVQINETVCKILYDARPDANPFIHSVTWIFADFDGVAYTTGTATDKEIWFSLRYVKHITKEKKVDMNELFGVMIHEATHVWQHSNGIPGGVLEGLTDAVRYKAGGCVGWDPKPELYQRWDCGYRQTAFFLMWIENDIKIPNFVSNLNANLKYRPWDGRMIEEMSGVPVKELWRRYQSLKLGKIVFIDVSQFPEGVYTIKSKSNGYFLVAVDGELHRSTEPYPWEIQKSNQGYTIIDPVSSKALDVFCYSMANGDKIVLWPTNGGMNQNWDITKPPRIQESSLKEEEFLIISEHSGKALDLAPDQIVQWDIHCESNQIWIIEKVKE